MAKVYRIALALNAQTFEEGRLYFMAAHRYARTRRDWHILSSEGEMSFEWDEALAMKPDGIIGMLHRHGPMPTIKGNEPRIVIVNSTIADHPFARVMVDDVKAGHVAAQHLIERGLASYAFVGWSVVNYSEGRRRGYEQAITEAGFADRSTSVDLMTMSDEPLYTPSTEWFDDLQKPGGIVCANDGLGVRMVEAALAAGLSVPDDLAIMGIDDIELQCVQSPVPMTSVYRDRLAQGYDAARRLDHWMRNGGPTPEPVLHPPGEVIERRSTQVFGEPDPLVRQALVIIHTPHDTPITVDEVVEQLGHVSRRRLELHFRQRLGRTPYQEILQARLAVAQRLLRSTSLSIDEIAYQTGFHSNAHISRPFKKLTGCTPTEYRQQHRVDRTE